MRLNVFHALHCRERELITRPIITRLVPLVKRIVGGEIEVFLVRFSAGRITEEVPIAVGLPKAL